LADRNRFSRFLSGLGKMGRADRHKRAKFGESNKGDDMRRLVIFIALTAVAAAGYAQEVYKDEKGFEHFDMKDGDSTYVMKRYFFVMLNAGPTRTQSKEEAAQIQEKHLAHITWMAKEGYIDLAGPMESQDGFLGILVFNVPDIKRVEELVAMDPAVKAGRLVMKIYPWWTMKGGKLR
jgi:uncharacterized protein YciI